MFLTYNSIDSLYPTTFVCIVFEKKLFCKKMEILRENFRAMIFYDYNLTRKQCIDRLHLAFGDEAPSNRTIYNWFAEFQRGCTFLSDEFREGRPSTSVVATNIDAMREMIERDRHIQ